jgi:hypothetical protein
MVSNPNQAINTGFYYVKGTTNKPPFGSNTGEDYRILTTAYSEKWLQQFATDFRTDDIFYRRCQNGSWTTWRRLAFADEITTS